MVMVQIAAMMPSMSLFRITSAISVSCDSSGPGAISSMYILDAVYAMQRAMPIVDSESLLYP